MGERKELVIIGSGPAGLSAAVYAQRAMIDQLVVEKEIFSGGQIVNTERIDNYLGLYGENGYDLAMKFRSHADQLQVPFMEAGVAKVEDKGDYKEIQLENGQTLEAGAVVIATGARHRLLGVPGEKEFTGAGVSYCATCDGAFYKDKTVAVVGGGDVALEDALYLANVCKKVYLIHRRDELRGTKILQENVFASDKIEFLKSCQVSEIKGDGLVQQIDVCDRDGNHKDYDIDGIFIAVGMLPVNEAVKDLVDLNPGGYIVAGEDCRTSCPGVYAIGDIRTKSLRQVATAVADGAVVITSYEQDHQ
ncbi:MAG: FAD-dependent oxidoreductase [Eubacterium sp.]|nr:FAD-dependent oxidoreductase [Eubacterium sp.]